ncbi:uncharacterized protein LOC134268358 [Saccostrea cucullata]|uniref:uncharacterized protein LOC134268358 n=1 Tax=Saccostrea cuccullata TaxID=36930 RepID=UPI002ED53BC6
MHPPSKHWYLIDYVIVRKRDRHDVRVTKAMGGAECWPDRRLIVSKLNFRIKQKIRPQETKAPKSLNIGKLKLPSTSQYFADTLEERLNSTVLDDHDVETAWNTLRNTVYNTAFEYLGPSTRKHKDYQERPLRNARSTVQLKLPDVQDSWMNAKADEIQCYADSHDTKNFYCGLKEVYGSTPSVSSPLLSADRLTLITENEKILNRWAEHFNGVLNRPSTINDEVINRLPRVPINQSLDAVPMLEEIQKAISLLSTGKAPGGDSIPVEIYKKGGMALVKNLHHLFELIWYQEKVPQDLKDTSIIHLYKRKGNRQACDNHRLIKHLEDGLLPVSQCGFRKNRDTIDMVFAARHLQEKCQEQNSDLYSTYVDLTKAFDTVSREGL